MLEFFQPDVLPSSFDRHVLITDEVGYFFFISLAFCMSFAMD